jgi:hypothetical protein
MWNPEPTGNKVVKNESFFEELDQLYEYQVTFC